MAGKFDNPFGMTECYYDKKDQFERLVGLLVPAELMWMCLDCKGGGTGFVGITTKRLMFMDSSWRKKANVIVSIPLDRIHAVGISNNYSFIGRGSGTLHIQAGEDDWSFEFRNAEKTRQAYLLLMHLVLNRDANTPDTLIPPLEEVPAIAR